MNKLRLFFLLFSTLYGTLAFAAIDDKAVGTWASDGARFYESGMIHTGTAVHLRKDGLGVVEAGYPPLGSAIRVANVIDNVSMHCVASGHKAIRPCAFKLRFSGGRLEIADRNGLKWQALKKISDRTSESLRTDYAWDQYDGEVARNPDDPSLQEVARLMSLPDFRESARRVRSLDALGVFQQIYWRYRSNKAFAVSAQGYYGYSASGLTDEKAATAQALKYCQSARNMKGGVAPCQIVNVNGQWLN